MPPKKDDKKQIIPIFKINPFWQYSQFGIQDLEKVDNFLMTFNNELKLLVDQQKSIESNYQILCAKIGICVHPCLALIQKEKTNFPQLKNTDFTDRKVMFTSHKVDTVTLKLLTWLLSVYKINCIKFSNNSCQKQILQIRKLFEKQDSITMVFFEWNQLPEIQNRKDFFQSLVKPSLQHLALRQCFIGNDILKNLLIQIKKYPEDKLKSLDLYGNNLSVEITEQLSIFVEESKCLEFIGLSKNSLNSPQFLDRLFHSIGLIAISEDQYQVYKVKQKARDQIIEKNKKKKKGVPEEPVPFLFSIKETQKGKFYVKNCTLKMINLSMNAIKDKEATLIRKFIEESGKNIEIFIEGNKFSKTVQQTFNFYPNVIV